MLDRTVFVLSFAFLAATAGAQTTQPVQRPPVIPASDGGVREVLESIVIPPIANHPFIATLVTDWDRYTPDGTTISFINERRVARDDNGRIYEERWALVPKNGKARSRMMWIQIADPQLRTVYNCNMILRACDLLRYDPAPDLAAATVQQPLANGPIPVNNATIRTENLGARIIDGLETVGTRTTTTLDPGTIGNDKPVVNNTETWRAEQLAINLVSIRKGPLIGTQTFTITDLNAAPPDPQFFQLPAGFPVRDLRTVLPPSQ
jgi:hypothetical protein